MDIHVGYRSQEVFNNLILLGWLELSINDFNQEEVSSNFRVCTVAPGRRDACTSYHDNNDIWNLSTKEYYHASVTPQQNKKENILKEESGAKALETNIPHIKTTSNNQYILHANYIILHLPTLFNFYNFRAAYMNWGNHRGHQKAIDYAVNILINGSHKHNKIRRREI